MKDKHPYSHYIAHRGLHDEASIDENSYEAFLEALNKGYAIECDVHLTLDNEVVIHHDATTKRMMNRDLDVAASLYEDLKALKHIHSEHSMMLLKDLLELVKGKVPLLIELKYSARGREQDFHVSKVLENYDGEFAVQSFDPFSCLWFKNNRPKIKRGLLIGHFDDVELNFIKKITLKNYFFLFFVSPHFIGLEWDRGSEVIVQKIRSMTNIGIIAWTVKTSEAFEFCKSYFDNVIFENEIILESK